MGVAEMCKEEVCMYQTLSLNPPDSFLHAQFNSYSFLYARLTQQFSGIGSLGKSLKKGYFLKKFQNILLPRPNKPKIKDWNQEASMNGRKESMAYCTMILSLKFKLSFVLQMWQTMQTIGLPFQ